MSKLADKMQDGILLNTESDILLEMMMTLRLFLVRCWRSVAPIRPTDPVNADITVWFAFLLCFGLWIFICSSILQFVFRCAQYLKYGTWTDLNWA